MRRVFSDDFQTIYLIKKCGCHLNCYCCKRFDLIEPCLSHKSFKMMWYEMLICFSKNLRKAIVGFRANCY